MEEGLEEVLRLTQRIARLGAQAFKSQPDPISALTPSRHSVVLGDAGVKGGTEAIVAAVLKARL